MYQKNNAKINRTNDAKHIGKGTKQSSKKGAQTDPDKTKQDQTNEHNSGSWADTPWAEPGELIYYACMFICLVFLYVCEVYVYFLFRL